MDTLIRAHGAVMDRYDPEKKAALVVDEWGTWHLTDKSVNPAFLLQQNSMRDAVIAGMTLNIFNNYSERVRMANIAQMVNVLQSVLLTKDEELVLTPTYHVFDLYKVHQDAERIECYVQQDLAGTEEAQVPGLSASASRDEEGRIHVTVVNTDPDEAKTLRILLDGGEFTTVGTRFIAGDMHAHNDFGGRNEVTVQTGSEQKVENGEAVLEIPACCVMALEIS